MEIICESIVADSDAYNWAIEYIYIYMARDNWITHYLLCDMPSNIYMAFDNGINILPSVGLCMDYHCDSARHLSATIGCRMIRRCHFGLILILFNTIWITGIPPGLHAEYS